MGPKAIIELITVTIKLFTARELNYNLRSLQELYEQEQTFIYQIINEETNTDSNPDTSYVLRLRSSLKRTRNLIKLLESKTFPSKS